MVTQTNYTDRMDAGVAGAIVNTEPNVLISRSVEKAEGLGFGVPVAQGANDKGCTDTNGKTAVLGVTAIDRGVGGTTVDTFTQGESARIMTKGVIWVVAGEAVAAGDSVYVTASTGAFKKTATGNVAIPNARFDTSAANGGLVQVRLA